MLGYLADKTLICGQYVLYNWRKRSKKGYKLKELWNEMKPCLAQLIMDELKSIIEFEQDDILSRRKSKV